jgi:hypothetical protein
MSLTVQSAIDATKPLHNESPAIDTEAPFGARHAVVGDRESGPLFWAAPDADQLAINSPDFAGSVRVAKRIRGASLCRPDEHICARSVCVRSSTDV